MYVLTSKNDKNFGLATFGKKFVKSTSPNAVKVIKTFYQIVSWPNYI